MNCWVRYPLRGFVGENALEIACCMVRITDELSELYAARARYSRAGKTRKNGCCLEAVINIPDFLV